jgi:hypothetical protein
MRLIQSEKVSNVLDHKVAAWAVRALAIGSVTFLIYLACHAQTVPTVPLKAQASLATPKSVRYFAVTALDISGQESTYSNEVGYTNDGTKTTITLAWDAPTVGSNQVAIASYKVYSGGLSKTYTNSVNVGLTTVATVQLRAPAKTNVWRLVAQQAVIASGPWGSVTNWPTISFTNSPPGSFALYCVKRTKSGTTYTVSGQVKTNGINGAWIAESKWPAFTTKSNFVYKLSMTRTNL